MGFQQGLSGLNATSKNLEVIGNNIANASTYGAKSSRAEFADVYASAMNGAGTNNIGIGVTLGGVSQQFTQGNIATTDNPMDLAINGAGFFQVSDGKNPTMFTRNGQFKVDRSGFIVNSDGNKLLGYPANGAGTILPGQAVPLQMPTAGIAPSKTDDISIEMNLDARLATTNPTTIANAESAAAAAAAAADPADTALAAAAAAKAAAATAAAAGPQIDMSNPDTYNNATSLTVYDAKGQDVALTYYFQKTGTDTWDVYVTANDTPLATDANGNPAPSTQIVFPSNGGKPTTPAGPVTLNIPSTTSTAGGTTLPIGGVSFDLSSATQYGSAFGVTDLAQNGYAAGQLVGVQVEDNGIVTARYSNGQSKPAGQVEIATFRNPQGLQPMGNNLWASTYATGDPIVGVPGDGSLGALQSGALEESNVDMTAELVNMITAQRIYQANAQTIKTEDSILQTLVSLR
jgi:flagellar hook protein FlgE